MDYQRLLHDYFDGVSDQESALFAELQVNEELREEFRSLFLMRKAARHDSELYVPPLDSASAILGRLGFASPIPQGGAGQEANAQNVAVAPIAVGRKRWEGYLQALIGGVVAAILILLFLRIGGYSVSTTPSPQFDKTTATSSLPSEQHSAASSSPGSLGELNQGSALQITAPAEVPVERLEELLAKYASALENAQKNNKRIDQLGGTASSNNPVESTENPSVVQQQQEVLPITSDESSIVESLPRDSVSAPHLSTVNPFVSDNHQGTDHSPFGTEYRRIASQSMRKVPAELLDPSDGFLKDAALSLTYRLNENQELGLTVGQEHFYQRFQELALNGDTILYRQNPLLYWGGVGLKHQFLRSTDLNPYVQVIAGGTRVGPMGRLGIGVQYQLTPILRLLAGGEFSSLLYTQDGREYYSGKYGLTYGVSFQY